MKKVIFSRKNIKKHEQNVVKSDFIISMYCDYIEKWSEYYTCNECEDEVNCKGHLTKLKETVHVDNFRKMTFNLRNS